MIHAPHLKWELLFIWINVRVSVSVQRQRTALFKKSHAVYYYLFYFLILQT